VTAGSGFAPPFGSSRTQAISLRIPPIMGIGLSWISLDSLVRIETFQWVTRPKAGKFFSRRFSPAFEGRENGSPQSWETEARDCSSDKLKPVSDFLQDMAVALWRSPPRVRANGRPHPVLRTTPGSSPGAGSSPRGRRTSAASAVRRLGSRRAPRRGKPVRSAPLEPIEYAIAEAPQRRNVVGQKHET
jgi:hypothetical protein